MEAAVQHLINKHNLFLKEDRLILGISGGADSVCLMHILLGLGYNFELAHCNFNLRGDESNNDELFVKTLAEKHNLKLHIKSFDTLTYAKSKKISTQMAARELRYNWFQDLLITSNANYIAIAHHANDDVETFFINMLRGTGIKGMLGIKSKNNKVVRPLLLISREDIEQYLQENAFEFREDSSNQSVKYLRNKIRHQLLPLLKEINPSIEETVKNEMEILSGVNEIYENHIFDQKNKLFIEENGVLKIEIEKVLNLNPLQNYIFELLSPFGFSEVESIAKSLHSKESGKLFFSKTHQLNIDRDFIFISKIEGENLEFKILENQESIETPIFMSLTKSNDINIFPDLSEIKLDYEKLKFPLVLRKWKKGDRFIPLGMKSFKKLSDFFIDNKFSILEKQQQWLLCSGDDIVWVVGRRIDERYKVQSNTKKVYIAQLLNK